MSFISHVSNRYFHNSCLNLIFFFMNKVSNREKDGERVPADPPGLMKIHLLSRDERLVNQVHFTTDYILWNKYKN